LISCRFASRLLLTLVVIGCSHNPVSQDDPDGLYKEAEEAFKDEHFLIAIEKFRDIKNRFPYSNRAIDSELRIADCYFDQESYLEAASSYEVFRELHPTHPKSDYVQYKIGLSYFNQIPSNSARDLSTALRAIESYKLLLDKYPSSEYASKAKDGVVEARKRLAEHEHYVADFYYRRRHYLSASYRYAALLQEFPESGFDEEGLFRLGDCYKNIRMYENAREIWKKLLVQFPETAFRSSVESELASLEKKN